MKQELTPQQIDELFAFCRRHYVHYYDVQLELVDHLANAIEEKMLADKKLSFENALNVVYNGFGYKGFAGVVEAKQNAVYKQWKQMRWQYFKSYFTWPKAALTLLQFAIVLFIHSIFSIDLQKWLLNLSPFAFVIYEFVIGRKFYKRNKKAKGKLLSIQYGNIFPFSSLLYFYIIIYFYHMPLEHWANNSNSFTALIFIQIGFILVMLILLSLAHQSTIRKILHQAETQYPQAFAS
jgi:hypothetical protein